MTPLRQRLIDDLRVRNYSARTIEAYVANVAKFAKHFGRSPDLLGPEDVRTFQLHLIGRQVAWSTFNQSVCALRFFFGTTLGRSDFLPLLAYAKMPKKWPCVLSPEEVAQLLDTARPGRDRVLLQTAYACGLRLGEVLDLQVLDLDSSRMLVHVRQGKGNKDRLVPLAPQLLAELRNYWRCYRPQRWLFPNRSEQGPLCDGTVQRWMKRLVVEARYPHVHGVVTGGGLSCNQRGDVGMSPTWRSCRPGFFLPVRVLSQVFRGKYLELLRAAFDQGQLTFPGRLAPLAEASAFVRWLTPLYQKDWIVYAKRPFAGPAVLLKYLTRYTHRVALTNRRLVKVSDNVVTLTYKDYAAGCAIKELKLSVVELLRRFALHVVPGGFVRIRHFGLLSHRDRGQRLAHCRALLAQGTPGKATVPAGPAGVAVSTAGARTAALPASAALPATAPTLAPILLVAALTSPAPAAPPSSLLGTAPLSTRAALADIPEGLCRQGRLEIFWRTARPYGRDFEATWSWNTS